MIPDSPGVYLMRDLTGKIIYIGKAKNLRKRISQYSGTNIPYKQAVMMRYVKRIDFIPTYTDREALLIEEKLIKRIKPKFNIMWKDDKSYPHIVITEEDFPRILITRRYTGRGRAFGPYPDVKSIKKLLRFIELKVFPFRSCKYDFDEKNLLPYETYSRCIYYQLDMCSKPCAGKISKEGYKKIINAVINFIKGKTGNLKKYILGEIKKSIRKLEFERALGLKNFLKNITAFKTDYRVYRADVESILSWTVDTSIYEKMADELGLKKPPYHIEAFDVSHFSGKYVVGASVCFRFFKSFTPHYRKYIIKKQVNDDYAAMYEIVYRRLKKIESPPDLIIVDGGIGQLNKALEAIKKSGKKVDTIAIAKPLEKIITTSGAKDVSSDTRLKIMSIRDEVHRFAIKFERYKRGMTYKMGLKY